MGRSASELIGLSNAIKGDIVGILSSLDGIKATQKEIFSAADKARLEAIYAKEAAVKGADFAKDAGSKAKTAADKAIDAAEKAADAAGKGAKILESAGRIFDVLAKLAAGVAAIFSVITLLRLGDVFTTLTRIEQKIDAASKLTESLLFRLRDLITSLFAQTPQWAKDLAGGIAIVNGNVVQADQNARASFRQLYADNGVTHSGLTTINGKADGLNTKADQTLQGITATRNDLNTGLKSIEGKQGEILQKLIPIGAIAIGVTGLGVAVAGISSLVEKLGKNLPGNCRFRDDPFSQQNLALTTTINTVTLPPIAANSFTAATNSATLLTRVGAQVRNGLGGMLTAIGQNQVVATAINTATLATTLHNAYMLSNSLAETLFQTIGNVLQVFGIKDENGDPFDITTIVSNKLNEMTVAILGQEQVTGIKAGWAKYNRIYQAAANIRNSILNIGYSVQEVLETTGEWIARIGNSLRRDGVVRENSFEFMNENLVETRRWELGKLQRVIDGLENAEDVISSIDNVANEVLEIQQTVVELGTQRDEFRAALEAAIPRETVPSNTTLGTAFDAGKTASQSPVITPTDMQPNVPEPEP